MRLRGRHSRGGEPPPPPDPRTLDRLTDRVEQEARTPGPRRRALMERRKRGRTRAAVVGAVALAIAGSIAALVVGAGPTPEEPRRPPVPENTAAQAPGPVTTLLLVGTRKASGGREAVWLTLLAVEGSDRGAIVYVPAHTAAEIPGRGFQALGESLATGTVRLVLMGLESSLGVTIDHHVELSEDQAEVLLQALGPLSVDVPSDLRVRVGSGEARTVLSEGLQRLPPSLLVHLLYTVGVQGDDIELGSRQLALWDALMSAYRDEPDDLSARVATARAALQASHRDAQALAALLGQLAALPRERLQIASLPVEQVGVGGGQLYSWDEQALSGFASELLGSADSDEAASIQLLNGNGVPGIGEEAAERLDGHGFRVVLSGNARRLDYEKTLVITYDRSEAGEAAARRVVQLLGVGEVRVSEQRQGIVDLTVVVGKDFLQTR